MVISTSCIPSGDWFMPEAFLSRTKKKLSETETFYDIIHKRMKEQGLDGKSNKKLIAATHLSGTICSRLKNDRNYQPSIETILAFCIGLGISVDDTKHLLMLKGYALSPENPIHCAYMDILCVYQIFGFGVQECNELLHSWGIGKKYFLGSFDLDEEM